MLHSTNCAFDASGVDRRTVPLLQPAIVPISLALHERDLWVELLQAFDRGEYRSKADDFLPSFCRLLDSLPIRQGAALDAGCGSGLLGRILLRRGWNVEGVDILPEAVDMAGAAFLAQVSTITDLPYPEASFDLVLCSMVLMLVEDIQSVVAELRRVLRPGGIILVAVVNPQVEQIYPFPLRGMRDECIATWRFPLFRDAVTIHYYRRSFAAYSTVLDHPGFESRWVAVHPGGILCPLERDPRSHSGAEYLWFIGQRRLDALWTRGRC